MTGYTLFAVAVAIAFAALIWHVVTTVMIYDNLRKRGLPVSFIWLRALGPFYAARYKKLTTQETGHAGTLFYHWVISINVALAAAVVALVLR